MLRHCSEFGVTTVDEQQMLAWLPLKSSADIGEAKLEWGDEPLKFEFKLNLSTLAASEQLVSSCSELRAT